MTVSLWPAIRAVVFDFDGLMLNTEDAFEVAGQQLLTRRGLVMTDTIRRSMLGRRPVDAFVALKTHTGITDAIEDLMKETEILFDEAARDLLRLMPGLPEVLAEVDRRNLPRAVATSSPREYLHNLLTRFDLIHRFPVTLTAEDVTHGKPHPEIYLAAADRLNVAPQEMLVLEDSETGTRAAAAAGARVVSVPNVHTRDGDFSVSHLVVESLHDPRLHALLSGDAG